MEEAGGLAGLAAQLSLPPSNLEFRQSAVSKGNDDDDQEDIKRREQSKSADYCLKLQNTPCLLIGSQSS